MNKQDLISHLRVFPISSQCQRNIQPKILTHLSENIRNNIYSIFVNYVVGCEMDKHTQC